MRNKIKQLGYTTKSLAERWGKTPRRINQILKNPAQIHVDAINGLEATSGS